MTGIANLSVYADTSFLASLYLRDTHLAVARSYLATHRAAIAFTSLQRFELRNAIRLAVFRNLVTASSAKNALSGTKRGQAADIDIDRCGSRPKLPAWLANSDSNSPGPATT